MKYGAVMNKNDINVSDVLSDVDYEKTIKEFGVQPINSAMDELKKVTKLDKLYRRNVIFAHRDLGVIIDAIKNHKKFAVVTGENPSGPLHFGNKLFVDQAKFFQENGADVFVPISNDETYVFKKVKNLDKATENAYNIVIPSLIALGLKKGKTHIFVSTRMRSVYELATRLSTHATFSMVKAIFGFNNETSPGQIFYPIVETAHILLPQLEMFGGPKPVVVPIGIDQDPYMRLCRDISEKEGFIKPSSTYHKFIRGLSGGKMSGSRPNSAIFLTDTPEDAEKKIMRAITGGGGTIEEHRKNGGNPENCSVFDYFKMHLIEDDSKLKKIYEECRSGKRICGECKKEAAELMKKFLIDFQEKFEKAKDQVDDYLLHER